MKRVPTVLAVAGDAGGAEALGVVLERLVADDRVRIRAVAYRQAVAIWRRRGLQYAEARESASDEDLYSLLCGVDLVLAATSVNEIDLERRCLELAQPLGIPSLVVLDNWSQYLRRFTDPVSRRLVQPDRIALMDDTARIEMILAGFEAERLMVTGQPALAELRTRREQFTAARRAELRDFIEAGESDAVVLFASQPLSNAFVTGETPVAVGYDEHRVLLALVAALEKIVGRHHLEVVLAIRPHPRESADGYEQYTSSVLRIAPARGFEGIEWALAADLVVGMTSLLVAQAAELGCVTVSLQPHTSRPDPLPINRVGLSTPVYLYSLIEPVVEALLMDDVAREEATSRLQDADTRPDAAERIADLAYELIDSERAGMTVTGRLAIHGGSPVRTEPFPTYNAIGEGERRRVLEVLDSGLLSGFTGTWTPAFYGGPVVRSLEQEWAEYFGALHAVVLNSATSGLYAAVGAAGIGPGDEVIVSPYTMSASATAPLIWGAIPVFADIDPRTFCLSPEAVRRAASERTRAIIAVDLFGQPAAMDELIAIADQHELVLIEDAAQSPGARLGERYAGTLGHIGVFSLNYHKMIHSGEGGVVVTGDPELAERVQLIRNHAEAVVEARGTTDLVNMVGFNLRMTEIEAAIASEQLKKLEGLIERRITAANYLSERLAALPGLTLPVPPSGVRHAYYVYALVLDIEQLGVPREAITNAVRAEGVPVYDGYVKPLHLAPLFQRRVAIGRDGFPFTYPGYSGSVSYERGICPVAERLHFSDLLYTDLCHPGMSQDDLDDVVRAFEKVLSRVDECADDG